jgi:hypothetical protein
MSNGFGAGTGFATTISGTSPSVQLSLQNATPNATYAVFACVALTGGDFDCAGRSNPPSLQQVIVAPRALSPITVNLVQQGTLVVDANGNGGTVVGLLPSLLPDTPHSIYNVVQLVNVNNAADSYTALDLQAPNQPVAGVFNIAPVAVSTVIGVPVYVLAPFPGYLYPVAITALAGVPFVPLIVVNSLPFSATVGVCPNGQPPIAEPAGPGSVPLNGEIALFCRQ